MSLVSQVANKVFLTKVGLATLLVLQSPYSALAEFQTPSTEEVQERIFNEEALNEIALEYGEQLSEMSDSLVEAVAIMASSEQYFTAQDMMAFNDTDCVSLCERHIWSAARTFGQIFRAKNRHLRRDGMERDERSFEVGLFSQQLLILLMAKVSSELPESSRKYLTQPRAADAFNRKLLSYIQESVEGWRRFITVFGTAITFVAVSGAVFVGIVTSGLGFVAAYLIVHTMGVIALSGAAGATTFAVFAAKENRTVSNALESLDPSTIEILEGSNLLH